MLVYFFHVGNILPYLILQGSLLFNKHRNTVYVFGSTRLNKSPLRLYTPINFRFLWSVLQINIVLHQYLSLLRYYQCCVVDQVYWINCFNLTLNIKTFIFIQNIYFNLFCESNTYMAGRPVEEKYEHNPMLS